MATITKTPCNDIVVPVVLSTGAIDANLKVNGKSPLSQVYVPALRACGGIGGILSEEGLFRGSLSLVLEWSIVESFAHEMYDHKHVTSAEKLLGSALCVDGSFIRNVQPFFISRAVSPRESWYKLVFNSSHVGETLCRFALSTQPVSFYRKVADILRGDDWNVDDNHRFSVDTGTALDGIPVRLYDVSCPGIIMGVVGVGDDFVSAVYDGDKDSVVVTYLVMAAFDNLYMPLCVPPVNTHNHDDDSVKSVKHIAMAIIHMTVTDYSKIVSYYIYGRNGPKYAAPCVRCYVGTHEYQIATA